MSSDALSRYHQKRNFDVTAEPRGDVANDGQDHPLAYFVQRHDASRLHFDFRLELDGVLKSWAIPKGPSLSPGEKRLAVEVEDHPLDYGPFEGTIPEGEYGGGRVLLWDRGTWTPEGDPRAGLKKGRLTFDLEGEQLHGRFSLVRMHTKGKQPGWLLLKAKDAAAKRGKASEVTAPGPFPGLASIEPSFATLVKVLPRGDGWLFEPKLDGYRALASIDGKKIELVSRGKKDWTDRFPKIRDALRALAFEGTIVDGEICALDDDGRPSFQKLQNQLSEDATTDLVYFVFDLLYLDGYDVRDRPLETRKALLASILKDVERPLSYVSDVPSKEGERLFQDACKFGLEGVIAKRTALPYREGRTAEWLKIKCERRQELVIVGYTRSSRRNALGALLLGVYDPSEKLRYVGKVGTGFTARSLDDLASHLGELEPGTPVTGAPRMKNAVWVEPKLVCEVAFSEWTEGGALRHPSFLGLREDKPAEDVHRERPKVLSKAGPRTEGERGTVLGVKVTNPERVIDDASGITKIELVRYFETVATLMLPFLARRPLALVRCPGGIGRDYFFQKRRMKSMPADIRERKVKNHHVLYIEDAEGLVTLAQFGAIEIHPWGSCFPKIDRPDWIVMDLDPAPDVPFGRVVDAAETMKEALSSLGLQSFVKTTGGKGLHVVAPIRPVRSFEEAKETTHAIAQSFATARPNEFVAVMTKKARTGKIFIDYLRNGYGSTAIAPYAPRNREGAPVAMPIAWRDLRHVDPMDFTVQTVPKILARRKKDPWEDFFAIRQTLP